MKRSTRPHSPRSSGLSPFFVGPIPMWGTIPPSHNLENAWQYSKVYADQVDEKGDPTEAWWQWMRAGIAQKKAVRFPRGRGAIPLYSYWEGKKMDYIEARHQIYAPLYSKAVEKTVAYGKLSKIFNEKNGKISLWDFDGYDHKSLGMTLEQVFYNTNEKMGHGFVLAMMLQNNRIWESPFQPEKIWSNKKEKNGKDIEY